MRLSFASILIFMTFAIFGLYQVKYEVRGVKTHVQKLEAKLNKERNSLHVLKAEWAYLNRPERLQHLSQKYFTMVPLSGTQLVDVKTLPPAITLHDSPILPAAQKIHE